MAAAAHKCSCTFKTGLPCKYAAKFVDSEGRGYCGVHKPKNNPDIRENIIPKAPPRVTAPAPTPIFGTLEAVDYFQKFHSGMIPCARLPFANGGHCREHPLWFDRATRLPYCSRHLPITNRLVYFVASPGADPELVAYDTIDPDGLTVEQVGGNENVHRTITILERRVVASLETPVNNSAEIGRAAANAIDRAMRSLAPRRSRAPRMKTAAETILESLGDVAGEPTDSSNACAICYTNKQTVALYPCRDMKFCPDCIRTLVRTAISEGRDVACPLCRSKVQVAFVPRTDT